MKIKNGYKINSYNLTSWESRFKKMASYAKCKILDLGFAAQPNPYLQGDVFGLDLNHVPCPANYKTVIIGNISNPCFAPASFDTIVAGEFIEHLEQPVQFLRDCRRILKLDGTLVLSTINPYYPPIILLNWLMIRKYYYAAKHIFEIAPRYMVRLLENTGFSVRRILSSGTILPIGRKHFLSIPLPKAICYQIIYIADAVFY